MRVISREDEVGISMWIKQGQLDFRIGPKIQTVWGLTEALVFFLEGAGATMLSASMLRSPDLLTPEDYARLYSAATGYQLDGQDLLLIGERIPNIEKAFNTLHASFTREDDYPPLRFTEEVISSGPLQGERLMKEKWDRVLDEYYELHGWDKATSWQTAKCLQKLGLQEVAEVLRKMGMLIE